MTLGFSPFFYDKKSIGFNQNLITLIIFVKHPSKMKKLSFLFILFIGLINAQKLTSNEISIINQGDKNSALPIYQTTDENQHKTLLSLSTEIDAKDPNTATLVKRMKESLLSTDGGVGIAAPQVGINRKIIWVQRFDKQNEPLEYFINPVIVWRSELQNLGPEGDLSIPEFRDQFYRSKVIQLEYVDLKGQKYSEIVEGFTAVIFQHEIDHLFGILISDKKEKEKNDAYKSVDAFKKSDSKTR
ncbi:peptide deformylase [Chryseobacterium polytrichastri]|uniref:Peptide deformylase-like n=2 Tax=Chryseobacterium polytrichastri TaxID=1302687 RepID=A0A1M6QJS4_9FLAO|nr:peptide deformylase [Chryseobacterium polytrichastri]